MGKFIRCTKGSEVPVVLTPRDLNPDLVVGQKPRLFGRGSSAVMPSFISEVSGESEHSKMLWRDVANHVVMPM